MLLHIWILESINIIWEFSVMSHYQEVLLDTVYRYMLEAFSFNTFCFLLFFESFFTFQQNTVFWQINSVAFC